MAVQPVKQSFQVTRPSLKISVKVARDLMVIMVFIIALVAVVLVRQAIVPDGMPLEWQGEFLYWVAIVGFGSAAILWSVDLWKMFISKK